MSVGQTLPAKRFKGLERTFLIRPHQPRLRHIGGEDRGGPRSGLDCFAGRQPQAGKVKLAMLWVPIPRCALHYDRRNRAQPPDDLSRFVEPSQMRITGRENAVGHRETRSPFERFEQLCRRIVEPAAEEVGFANSVQIICPAITRAEAQEGLKMLEREIGFAGKYPENAAPV